MHTHLTRSGRPVARSCLVAAITAFLLGGCTTTDGGSTTRPAAASGEKAEFLFVQTADSVSFQGNTMTLHGIAPTTLYFTDRPVRITGHEETSVFIGNWGAGEDSFAADPPNAALSVLGNEDREVGEVVVELRNPQLRDGNLTYTVDVLEGTPPATGDICALFIDAEVASAGAMPYLRPSVSVGNHLHSRPQKTMRAGDGRATKTRHRTARHDYRHR